MLCKRRKQVISLFRKGLKLGCLHAETRRDVTQAYTLAAFTCVGILIHVGAADTGERETSTTADDAFRLSALYSLALVDSFITDSSTYKRQ